MPLSAATTGLSIASRCTSRREQSRAYCADGVGVAQQRREAADVGAGAERPRAVAGDDEAGDRRVVLVAPDHGEDLVGHLVVQRIQRLGPAQRDDVDAVEVVDQHVALGPLVVGAAARSATGMPGRSRAKRSRMPRRSRRRRRSRISSSGPRLKPSATRQPRSRSAALADAAVEDVDALRQQHAEQAVADRAPPSRARPRARLPGGTVTQLLDRAEDRRPAGSARLPRRPAACWSRR